MVNMYVYISGVTEMERSSWYRRHPKELEKGRIISLSHIYLSLSLSLFMYVCIGFSVCQLHISISHHSLHTRMV